MDVSLFDYELPADRIAQVPLDQRDASKLLVFHRASGRIEHRIFRDLSDYLGPTDRLFRNNASVLPARLRGRRPTGGAVECFLHRPTEKPLEWWCLLRPGRKVADGSPFGLEGHFSAQVIEHAEDGAYLVRFSLFQAASVPELAHQIGSVPLPPYIQREPQDVRSRADKTRYQTVYANPNREVAVAAPTAGLHFTPQLLQTLGSRGVQMSDVTLHVGLGTFRPIQTRNVEDHNIHRELYEVPEAARRDLLDSERRRIAVGTTVVRTLEDYCRRDGFPTSGPATAEADIYIHPPFEFKSVQALITNFHQPKSTLLCLVSAFLSPGSCDGICVLHELYREALRKDYRFLSYGDAMFIC